MANQKAAAAVSNLSGAAIHLPDIGALPAPGEGVKPLLVTPRASTAPGVGELAAAGAISVEEVKVAGDVELVDIPDPPADEAATTTDADQGDDTTQGGE